MRALLAAAVLAAWASSVCAQDERKRMVFPPGASEPVPTATPAASAESKEGTPPAAGVDLFFLALKAENVDGAYDQLVRGTIIAERKEDVESLKERTRQALDSYGPVSGYEIVEELTVGKHLARKTCISLNTDLPLRWRFYFYLTEGEWRLVDLRVDDGLVELFEDSARRQRP